MIKYISSFIIVKTMAKINIALSLLLGLIIAVMPVYASMMGTFDVKIVSYVYDYGKVIPRWSNVFEKGDTLKLYLAYQNPNSNVGALALDFVIYIKDPNGYVVYKKIINVRKLGYYDHIYEVLDIPIDKNWLPGKYTLEAYVFDVLDYTSVLKSYMRYNVYEGSGGGKIKTVNRKDAPFTKRTLTFYVKNGAVYPPDRFIVFDARFEKRVVPVGIPNEFGVSVFNNYQKDGKIVVGLMVDGKIVERHEVYLGPYEVKRIKFTVPPLPKGVHVIKVVAFDKNVKYESTPPIFVKPLLYDKPILVGKILRGCIIYSPNDYVLGSVGVTSIGGKVDLSIFNSRGYVMNRESAMEVLTNVIAYDYRNYVKGPITVALLKDSDSRARQVLPALIDYVKDKTNAPVQYLGVRSYGDLGDVNLLIYVGSKAPNINELEYFFDKGGVLFVDDVDYWKDLSGSIASQAYIVKNWTGFRFSDELYKSYFDFGITKIVTVLYEKKVPPKFVFSDLRVSKFLTNVGEPVTITFKVKNIGGSGTSKVMVSINGEVVFKKTITLKTGEITNLSFDYIPRREGSYKVQIKGTNLMAIFFAKSNTTSVSSGGSIKGAQTTVKEIKASGGAGLVVGSAALLAALIIIRLLIRE